ncbi:MAG: hypothetical protein IT222_00605 [Crocinitomix sp.]|nr:hypothetical protein [Crocinitomix sp.]
MNIKKLLPIVGVFVFFACTKDPIPPDPTTIVMPPLTHQGINTFGCYMNGELFVANVGESVWSVPPVSGTYNELNGDFGMQGSRHYDTLLDAININADVTNGVGIYNFKTYSGGTAGYSATISPFCDYYYEDTPNLGKLTITHLDEEKNIISGTFYMNLINTACEEDTLLKITDGRFDWRY